MERLGVGPDVCLKRNPKLVYGRMTGWGQTGPLANAAGHDINYIALTGALARHRRRDRQARSAAQPRRRFRRRRAVSRLRRRLRHPRSEALGQGPGRRCGDDGRRCVADGDVLRHERRWACGRTSAAQNLLDSGAHFYDTYETKDGKWIALGSIEPQFYRELIEKTGITDTAFDAQMDRAAWPALKEKLAAVIKTKTRDEWDKAIMLGSDVCYAPVLSLAEAPKHPHNVARQTFVEVDGVVQPAPAPRFSRTVPEVQGPSARGGQRRRAQGAGVSRTAMSRNCKRGRDLVRS